MKTDLLLVGLFLCGVAIGGGVDEKGFVRDWLVSGPWPSYESETGGKGLETDFLAPEDEAQPAPGDKAAATFVADWSKLVAGLEATNEWGVRSNMTFDATWRPLHAKEGIIRFNGTFGAVDDHFVVYAACYVDSPREQSARLAVGSDDDHKVYLNLTQVGKVTSSQDILPGSFKYDVVLPKGRSRLLFKLQDRTGGCGFCVQLTDRADKPLQDVSITLDTRGVSTALDAILAARRSPEKLRARLDAARKTASEARAALAEVMAERTVLSNACNAAKRRLVDAYAAREAQYAAEHVASAAKGTRSVDEPFVPLSRRSTLCLNGLWESSADGKTWGRTHLPHQQLNSYFEGWCYPIRDGKPLPAYAADYDSVPFAEQPRFRTTFAWDGVSDVTFRCDAILGVKPTVSVNGVVCGTWNGDRGVVRIPLKGLRKGENVLEIVSPRGRGGLGFGLRGDIFLETLPKVRVDDVWVRTSWRKSTLGAETELVNRSSADVTAEVAAYAVRDGKVRFRLPVRRVKVAAGGKASLSAQAVWSDPETWGIGGSYGEPNLYTFVTDVSVDGRVVDRHEVEFGFREFWICHTDFFLNGRRILLRGDVGHLAINDKRRRDVVWPLYRADGINLVRVHDSDQWSVTAARDADRMGMVVYAQMYPILSEPGAKHAPDGFSPFETWQQTATHRRNLAAYERWWRDFRNHASVLIWSTDNEILTQANDTEARSAFNIRNDRIGELYEKYMKTLDPSLVLSRDGDVGTWNSQSRWFENPPCDTANYHYPDFNNDAWAESWQVTYEFRPVIFGEALYCSYLRNGWVGGLPKLVADKATQLNRCLPLYEELEIPCAIFMGLGLDGFTLVDDTGKGNPWGLRASDVRAFNKDNRPIPNRRADQYPWLRIDWPALSGEGERDPADRISTGTWGTEMVNVYEAGFPSHVRNAVNDAYRNGLRPQPPIDAGRFAEAVVTAEAFADVWTTSPAGNRVGVRADGKGRAWFRSLAPGNRAFTCGAAKCSVDLPARGKLVAKPGFVDIPRVELKPDTPWRGAYVDGRTVEGKCFYGAGETMTFRLQVGGIKSLPEGEWKLKWTRTGDDGVKQEGCLPVSLDKPCEIRTSLDRPGFVRIQASVVGAPEEVRFSGGAGVDFAGIVAKNGEPDDFDAFWQSRLASLARVPFAPQLVELASPKPGVKLYTFRLGCAGGRPATGYLSVPEADGKYPVRLFFYGYRQSWRKGVLTMPKAKEMSPREIQLRVNAHGLDLGREDDYYEKARQSVSWGGFYHGWNPVENEKPETCYFLDMILRDVRAAQYAQTLPKWNGRDLVVCGGSQGALQSVIVAALCPQVSSVEVGINWLCDMRGKAIGGRLASEFEPEHRAGLDYFDEVFHARRISPSCSVDVTNAALGDYTAPPSGIACLYNALRCRKRIAWVQNAEHSWQSTAPDRQVWRWSAETSNK